MKLNERLDPARVEAARYFMYRATFAPAEIAPLLRKLAYGIMAPGKRSIKSNDNVKLWGALSLAHSARAQFDVTACAGETCEHCSHPKWMHIHITPYFPYVKWETLHPGENVRYWIVATAIFAVEGLNPSQIREALKPIAVATRRSVAPTGWAESLAQNARSRV